MAAQLDFSLYEILGGIAQCIVQSRIPASPDAIAATPERNLLLKTILLQELVIEERFSRAWNAFTAHLAESNNPTAAFALIVNIYVANRDSAGSVVPLESFVLRYEHPVEGATSAATPAENTSNTAAAGAATADPTAAAKPAGVSRLLAQKQLDGKTIKQCVGLVTMVRSLMGILRILPGFSFANAIRSNPSSALNIVYDITVQECVGSAPTPSFFDPNSRSTRLDLSPVHSELGSFLLAIQYRDSCDFNVTQPLAASISVPAPAVIVPPSTVVPNVEAGAGSELPPEGELVSLDTPSSGSSPAIDSATVPDEGGHVGDEHTRLPPPPEQSPPRTVAEPAIGHTEAAVNRSMQLTLSMPLINFLNQCETAHQYRLRMFESTVATPSFAELEAFLHKDLAKPLGVAH